MYCITRDQGPRSNFWIEGGRVEFPFLLRSFSTFFRFFNFLSFFLKLSCGCDVFMFIVGFFRSLLVNIGKNVCMLFRRQSFCLLLSPFAGCQSAFFQNHSQNVNEVLLT